MDADRDKRGSVLRGAAIQKISNSKAFLINI